MDVRAFVQARMSSRRFPGKVLASLRGRPVIDHVVDRLASVLPVVVATSTDRTDDPLACHLQNRGVDCFRGPLDDVFQRFRLCLEQNPCRWFVRISADSPMMDPEIVRRAVSHAHRTDLDLVTNVHPRSFPRGRSVEMILSETYARIRPETDEEREHVTPAYYRHPERYRILNLVSDDAAQASENLCGDTPEDLRRLEAL